VAVSPTAELITRVVDRDAATGDDAAMSDDDTDATPRRLTFVEAADRLGISPDAVRLRVRRRTLATVVEHGEPFVVWPQPAPTPTRPTPSPARPSRQPSSRPSRRSSATVDDATVAAMRDEITFLRAELERRSEEIRRRDHLLAAALERIAELPAETAQDAAVAREKAPRSDDRPEMASDSMALAWRRWWRRIRGDAS
jgi:hypothetical protein